MGYDFWDSPNADATNECRFSDIPSGWRLSDSFTQKGMLGHW